MKRIQPLAPISTHELGQWLLEQPDLPIYARILENDTWVQLYNADFSVETIRDTGKGSVRAVAVRP